MCDCIFERSKELVVHHRDKQKQEIKCNICGEMFNFTFELEHNLKKNNEVKELNVKFVKEYYT